MPTAGNARGRPGEGKEKKKMLKNKPMEVGDILKVTDRLTKRTLKKAQDDGFVTVSEGGTIEYETVVKAVGRELRDGKERWVVMHHPQKMPGWLRSGRKRNPSFEIESNAEQIGNGRTGNAWGIVSWEKVGRDY